MTSIRQRILDQIALEIGGAGKPTGLVVEGKGGRPDQSDAPYVVRIIPVEEAYHRSHESEHSPLTVAELAVEFDIDARSTQSGPHAWVTVEPVLTWIWQTMKATDPPLGGLADLVEPVATAWNEETFDKNYVQAVHRWRVVYPTALDDPTAQP